MQKVTGMAYAQIRQFGFNDVVGLVSFEQDQQGAGGRRPFSKRLAATMDHEARKLIAEAYQKTETILNVRNMIYAWLSNPSPSHILSL